MRIRFLCPAILILLAAAIPALAAPPDPQPDPEKQQPIHVFFGLSKPVEAEFTKLSNEGVTSFIDYYSDFMANPSGGLMEGNAYSHELLFGMDFDFGKLAGVNGSSLMLSGAQSMGANLSGKIGNLFYVSESYVTPGIRFYQCYFKQKLFEDKLEVCLGRMTAASDFATLPAFGLQANGGINGNPTSLFLNTSFTSSPNATWGGTVKYHFTDDMYVEGGIYQATSSTTNRNYYGLNFSIHPPQDGLLALNQIGWEPTFGASASSAKGDSKAVSDGDPGLPGTYLVGDYYSYYDFPQLNGPNIEHNAYGFFAMGQQMVWRQKADPNVSVSLWGGATYSPQIDIALMPAMGFMGVVWQGAIPGRDMDQVLLTYMVGGLSDDYANAVAASGGNRPTAEHVIESSYIVQLNERVSVQPDVQYVIQPGGDSHIPNAVVVGLQVTATF